MKSVNKIVVALILGIVISVTNVLAQDETNNEYCGCLTTSGEIKSISINDPNSEPQKPCKNNEKKVCWNQQGVPGTDGQDGQDGVDGQDGMDAPTPECPCDWDEFFGWFDTIGGFSEVTNEVGSPGAKHIQVSGKTSTEVLLLGDINTFPLASTGEPQCQWNMRIIFEDGTEEDVASQFERGISYGQSDVCNAEISARPELQ